jgi:8-oxo-dGTP diphosphatase
MSNNTLPYQVALSVDCVILGFINSQLKVLLIKSDHQDFRNEWSLLGDLVRPYETLECASYRVLKERTGLEDVYLEQVHTFSDIDRHPAGRVISTAYYSLVNIRHHQLKLADNELHWHTVSEIQSLAFDHLKILRTCIRKLQQQINDHPIIFNMLPEKFSLRELQTLYEEVMETKMDRRNFRKKFMLTDWLEDVDELESDVSHRPGRLYRFNKRSVSSLV